MLAQEAQEILELIREGHERLKRHPTCRADSGKKAVHKSVTTEKRSGHVSEIMRSGQSSGQTLHLSCLQTAGGL